MTHTPPHSTPVIVTNPLRARLTAIFAMPYPFSGLLFRYYVGRLVPMYKTVRIEPLVLSQSESVVAISPKKSLMYFGGIVHTSAMYCLAQAAAELGLMYNMEGKARLTLEKMDMVFHKEVRTGVVARSEWSDEEITLLRESNGKIIKGVALVDEDSELCAKAVFQFRWKRLST